MSAQEIYKIIYDRVKGEQIGKGLPEDKASRKANIYAVKNTWKDFNSIC